MWATSIHLLLLRRGHYHWSTRAIDPIKILVKDFFDLLSALEFRSGFLNIMIAREALQQ